MEEPAVVCRDASTRTDPGDEGRVVAPPAVAPEAPSISIAPDSGHDDAATSDLEGRASLAAGTIIGRYRLESVVGEGGQGFVYRAAHFALDYPVAIKVLRGAEITPLQRARVKREARVGAQLRHPHIVAVLDAGELDDKSPYIVMEYVEGVSLHDLLERRRLTPAATIELALQLLSALTALHERAIVHRDIKPANVMLRREVDGCVNAKLLDFGISKVKEEGLLGRTITRTGTLIGTPQYMSPEHLLGRELDVRSDIYALSAVLYECLAGMPPHDATATGAVLVKIATEPVAPLREVAPGCPRALAAVIDRGLEHDRVERWAHPLEMAQALREAAEQIDVPRGLNPWSGLLDEPGPEVASEGPQPARASIVVGSGRPVLPRGPGSMAWKRRLLWIGPIAAIGLFGSFSVVGVAWSPGTGPSAQRPPPARVPPIETVRAPQLEAPAIEPVIVLPALTVAPLPVTEPAPAQTVVPPAPIASSAPAVARPVLLDDLERSARGAFVRGDLPRSMSLYRRLTARAPERASAWRGLGLVAAARGDRAMASRGLQRYLALSPNAPDRGRIERELARLDER